MYMVNEFSMESFDIIKKKIKKKLNINEKNNGKNKRKMKEINDKIDIEYKKSNISNNGNINNEKLKSKADDDSRNANFYSKNVSTLKENKNILTKKRSQSSDNLLLKIINSHYLRTRLKSISS